MPKTIKRIVRNRSSRRGVTPRLIVLHTTEGTNRAGLSDLLGLASWFDNPASQASSHLGIDQEGNAVRMVPDAEKSWTQVSYNPQALSIEQVGFASSSTRYWVVTYDAGLRRTAQALARWSNKYKIPLKLSTYKGVCEHRHLGQAGGGHHDCGVNYPLQYVLDWAYLWRWRFKGSPAHSKPQAEYRKRRILAVQRKYGNTKGTN